MLHNTGLRDLRSLTQQAVELLSNTQQQETDEQYKIFLGDQITILNKALNNAETPDGYKVAIVGSFKVGKSSFVNALCNVKGLASVNVNPETAAITIFRCSDNSYAEIHMTAKEEWDFMAEPYKDDAAYSDDSRYGAIYKLEQSGKLKEEFSTSLAELEQKYISNPRFIERIECLDWSSQEKRSAFGKEIKQYMSRRNPVHHLVDRLEVYVPVPLLRGGIELIDTPGLNDTDRYRVRLTEELVENVDVILYLTTSGAAYSQSDKDFITTQLRKNKIKHLLVIVTKCDETFENTLKDAEDNQEKPPTFQEHLAIEEKRIREQIRNTLDELLSDSKLADEQGYFIIEQLDDVNISFISSRYYQDGKKAESGIDELRDKLIAMLAESERITKAKQILVEALNNVYDRTSRNFRARLEATTKDFNADRVRNQLQQISIALDGRLASFQKVVEEQAELLGQHNRSDWELITIYILNILLQTDNLITNEFEKQDISKHWKTRRYHGWGYLDDIQNKTANHIFIPMGVILERYAKTFRETLGRIREQLERLQKVILEIEQSNSLDGALQPVNLTEIFDNRYKLQLDDLNNFVASQKQRVVAHLDRFISDEVQEKIYKAREDVADIWGRGTTWRQNNKIISFYHYLKEAIKDELSKFLTSEVKNFSSTLEKKARLIYPELKNDLDVVMEDHLKAIEANLLELNQHQREILVKHLTGFLDAIEEIQQTQINSAK